MTNYYVTFGSWGQLYQGGWIRIKAKSLAEAQRKFISRFGKDAFNSEGFLRCASFYSEEEFTKTEMPVIGNMNAFEHEYLE